MNPRLTKAFEETFSKTGAATPSSVPSSVWIESRTEQQLLKQAFASAQISLYSAGYWGEAKSPPARVLVLDESLLEAPLRIAAVESDLATAKANLAATRNEVRRLRQQVEELSSQIQHTTKNHSYFDPIDTKTTLDAVSDLTTEVFGATPSIAAIIDPETGSKSFEVSVEAAGHATELVHKSDQWHRKIATYAGKLSILFSLSITPTDERD